MHTNTFCKYRKNYAHRLACILLFKKSMSPNIKCIEIKSKRVRCIRVNTDMGLVYLFNVYMPCDTNTNEHLCDYNNIMILTDIAKLRLTQK